MLTVDEYIRIREMVLVDGLSQREVARRLGHSRKTIRKVLKEITPPGYPRKRKPKLPAIDPVRGYIDAWLARDKTRPRKQRHTAQRIYDRLKDEHQYKGSASAVRRYVAYKLSTSGEVYYPLVFTPGEEAQVDWGEARVIISGVERKVMLFCMRLCHSTASFGRAYWKQDQGSLLDGLSRAFVCFGGGPQRCAFDNLKSAVITVGRGQERELTRKFKELVSHYLFKTRFCNVAAGNEKGHVENLVKHAQRTFMTPLPECADLGALNVHLETECEKDLDRVVAARKGKIRRELLVEEQACLRPLEKRPFAACLRRSTLATQQALVRFEGNDYSVPVRWAHHQVTVHGYVDRVELHVASERVAVHERCHESGEFVLDPYHYIPLLEKKPGGIHNARPFKGEPWGEDLAWMRRELEYRYGGEGTKKWVNILLLFDQYPQDKVKRAVRLCVRRGAYSDEAVQGTLNYLPPPRRGSLDLAHRPELALIGDGTRPAGTYDALLSGQEVSA